MATAWELPTHNCSTPAPTASTVCDMGLVAQVRSTHPDVTQEWLPHLSSELCILIHEPCILTLIPEPWGCKLCMLIHEPRAVHPHPHP